MARAGKLFEVPSPDIVLRNASSLLFPETKKATVRLEFKARGVIVKRQPSCAVLTALVRPCSKIALLPGNKLAVWASSPKPKKVKSNIVGLPKVSVSKSSNI